MICLCRRVVLSNTDPIRVLRMSNYAYFGPYELLRKQFGMTSGSSGELFDLLSYSCR